MIDSDTSDETLGLWWLQLDMLVAARQRRESCCIDSCSPCSNKQTALPEAPCYGCSLAIMHCSDQECVECIMASWAQPVPNPCACPVAMNLYLLADEGLCPAGLQVSQQLGVSQGAKQRCGASGGAAV